LALFLRTGEAHVFDTVSNDGDENLNDSEKRLRFNSSSAMPTFY